MTTALEAAYRDAQRRKGEDYGNAHAGYALALEIVRASDRSKDSAVHRFARYIDHHPSDLPHVLAALIHVVRTDIGAKLLKGMPAQPGMGDGGQFAFVGQTTSAPVPSDESADHNTCDSQSASVSTTSEAGHVWCDDHSISARPLAPESAGNGGARGGQFPVGAHHNAAPAPSIPKPGYAQAAARAGASTGTRLLDTHKLRDGRAIGWVRWGELDGLVQKTAVELAILERVRRRGVAADPDARVRDLLTDADFGLILREAKNAA